MLSNGSESYKSGPTLRQVNMIRNSNFRVCKSSFTGTRHALWFAECLPSMAAFMQSSGWEPIRPLTARFQLVVGGPARTC